MKPKILVIEDDLTIQETIVYNLNRNGYEVFNADNGRDGVALARSKKPDLVVLDVMLPEIDGIEVCRILRKETNVPILMLTALSDEIDKVIGLEVGADDYLTKPFSMREAESSNENTAENRHNILQSNNLMINLDRREIYIDSKPLRVKPKEYELLVFLVRNKGIALSRDLILERVWGWMDDHSRTVDVHIRWLREKLGQSEQNTPRISTVRGVGYRFEG